MSTDMTPEQALAERDKARAERDAALERVRELEADVRRARSALADAANHHRMAPRDVAPEMVASAADRADRLLARALLPKESDDGE